MFAWAARIAALLYVLISMVAGLAVMLRPSVPRPLLTLVRVEDMLSLWLVDVDRGYELRLLDDLFGVNYTWSPDGQWLAYENFVPALGWNAYLFRMYDHAERFVASPLASFNPSWSPDARWTIVYNNGKLLYLPSERLLTDPLQTLDTGVPDALWSPDSTKLYYLDALNILGVIETACLNAPPCVRSLVPVPQPVDQLVGWMPDRQQLMVTSRASRSERYGDLYRLDPNSGDMERVLPDLLPGPPPVWSNDGEVLAASIVRTLDLRPLFGEREIPALTLVYADGSAPRIVWEGVTGQLSWTPDGDRLAFETVAVNTQIRAVYIYNRMTDQLTRMTAPGLTEMLPKWLVYSGRPFDGGVVLAVSAWVGVGGWLAAKIGKGEARSTPADDDHRSAG